MEEKKEKRKYRKYSGELKEEVVRKVQETELGRRAVGREYGIPACVFIKWEKIYQEKGYAGLYKDHRGGVRLSPPKPMTEEERNDLESRVKHLEMENEYLKKLQALVANKQAPEKKQK